MDQKQPLPNAVAVLVLGICSIVLDFFLVGLALGIIGLVLSGKGRRLHQANPEAYSGHGMLLAGYIMSLIGTILGGLYILFLLLFGSILAMIFHW